MRKINAKIISVIPGRDFIDYCEDKTAKDIFRYAYSQLRIFAKSGVEYSLMVVDLDTRKELIWLHGFRSNLANCYMICGSSGDNVAKELFSIPLA